MRRWSEFIALISLSTTLFLFLHTRDLALQLDQERRGHEGEEEQQDHFLSRELRGELSTAGEERTEYYGQVRAGVNPLYWGIIISYRTNIVSLYLFTVTSLAVVSLQFHWKLSVHRQPQLLLVKRLT